LSRDFDPLVLPKNLFLELPSGFERFENARQSSFAIAISNKN